jgi:cation:H+ antiporter
MLLATALLIIGLLLVVYSADRLVYAASILCRMLGIPPLIIGMTVVSIGTSLPEIMVSAAASLHGQTDLAIGTALGSNITNILILGLAALLRPFTVHSDILRRELPLMLLVSLLAGLCCTMDNCPVSTAFFYWRWPCCGCCLPLKSPVWRNARAAIA